MQLRCITIFLMLVLLPSCGWSNHIRSMEFRPENSSWTIKYNPDGGNQPNSFIANYESPEGVFFNLYVYFNDTYHVTNKYFMIYPITLRLESDNYGMCKRKKYGYVQVSIIGPRVKRDASIKLYILHTAIFDNSSVHITKSNGQEIFMYDTGKKIKKDGLYKLDNPETLQNRPSNPGTSYSSIGTPVFYYYLRQTTCADYEGATFVIDGIYYNNQKIPPLVVHMQYEDFSEVPQ